MEVKLFLFTVLQIRLFSPWSAGRWSGLGCSADTAEAWPDGTAVSRGWEAMAEGGCSMAASRLVQTHRSLFD